MRSPLPTIDDLESDTWYQVSAISERAVGVFSEPVYAVAKTHREPARVIDSRVSPVQGSTDSLAMMVRLDCSSAPINEACGLLRYTWNFGEAVCSTKRIIALYTDCTLTDYGLGHTLLFGKSSLAFPPESNTCFHCAQEQTETTCIIVLITKKYVDVSTTRGDCGWSGVYKLLRFRSRA